MLTHSSSNCVSLPSSACTRGITRSGWRSATGSASQPSWKSMRQTSSGCRCSSTDWFGWNGGSNQNQRSAGKVRLHLHIGDQEAVAEDRPLLSSPSASANRAARAVGGDQPVAARADTRRRASRRGADFVRRLARPRRPCSSSGYRGCGRARARSSRITLEIVLLEIDEGGPAMAGLGQEIEAVDRLVVEKDLADIPGHACVDHRSPQPSRSKISSVRLAKQIARDPSRAGRRRQAARPRRLAAPDRSPLLARPGPAPTTTTP